MEADAARLIAIEEKVAYLEAYTEQLDGALREAFEELRRAHTRVDRLTARLASLEEPEDGTRADEKPPHY